VPSTPLRPDQSVFTLTKRLLTPEGRPADPAALRQGDRLIVLLEGRMPDRAYREMALLDLLPAGVEVETVVAPGADTQSIYPWLPKLTGTDIAEGRDDRFVAAFKIGDRYPRPRRDGNVPPPPRFAVAYQVRAVTPGTFALPAAVAEDMYSPRVMARTAMGTMSVTAYDG
jgi:hypothetical protein